MPERRDLLIGLLVGSGLTFVTFALASGRFRFRAQVGGVDVGFV